MDVSRLLLALLVTLLALPATAGAVTGGQDASRPYPHMAAFEYQFEGSDEYEFVCGASLIARDERRDGNDAPVAQRETRPFPKTLLNRVSGVLFQRGRNPPDVAGGRRWSALGLIGMGQWCIKEGERCQYRCNQSHVQVLSIRFSHRARRQPRSTGHNVGANLAAISLSISIGLIVLAHECGESPEGVRPAR